MIRSVGILSCILESVVLVVWMGDFFQVVDLAGGMGLVMSFFGAIQVYTIHGFFVGHFGNS